MPKLTGTVNKTSDLFFRWQRASRNKQLASLNRLAIYGFFYKYRRVDDVWNSKTRLKYKIHNNRNTMCSGTCRKTPNLRAAFLRAGVIQITYLLNDVRANFFLRILTAHAIHVATPCYVMHERAQRKKSIHMKGR